MVIVDETTLDPASMLTMRQVRQQYELNWYSIRAAMAAGDLPAWRKGPRVILFRREDVERLAPRRELRRIS